MDYYMCCDVIPSSSFRQKNVNPLIGNHRGRQGEEAPIWNRALSKVDTWKAATREMSW